MICRRRRCVSSGTRLGGRGGGWLCGLPGARQGWCWWDWRGGTKGGLWVPEAEGSFGPGQGVKVKGRDPRRKKDFREWGGGGENLAAGGNSRGRWNTEGATA